jgi:sensor c-di-GMP phosphodiesterase-like protein
VIAEGVEDQHTWNELASLGCHAVQGHYLAKPMPAQDLPAWLERYNRHRHNMIPRQRREPSVQLSGPADPA